VHREWGQPFTFSVRLWNEKSFMSAGASLFRHSGGISGSRDAVKGDPGLWTQSRGFRVMGPGFGVVSRRGFVPRRGAPRCTAKASKRLAAAWYWTPQGPPNAYSRLNCEFFQPRLIDDARPSEFQPNPH